MSELTEKKNAIINRLKIDKVGKFITSTEVEFTDFYKLGKFSVLVEIHFRRLENSVLCKNKRHKFL